MTALNRAQTSVSAAINITPINHISGDVGGLLGNFLFQLLGMFFPRRVCARANVVVTELITNVMEHASSRDGEIGLVLTVNPQELVIEVSNSATTEEYEAIRGRFEEIANAKDPKQLLARTVYERHNERRRGGLGSCAWQRRASSSCRRSTQRGFWSFAHIYPWKVLYEGSHLW